MKPKVLKKIPTLEKVLSHKLIKFYEYDSTCLHNIKEPVPAKEIFSLYIDVCELGDEFVIGYSGLDLFNDKELLNIRYQECLGFLYKYIEAGFDRKHLYAKAISNFFHQVASFSNLEIKLIKTNVRKISKDIETCIALIDLRDLNLNKLSFYQGWLVQCKHGEYKRLYLYEVFLKYGSTFTDKIHKVIDSYIRTQRKTTAEQTIVSITIILRAWMELFSTYEKLEQAMSHESSHISMLNVYNYCLIEAKMKDHCIEYFHNRWKNIVYIFYAVFIEREVFPEPSLAIVTPKFKSSGVNKSQHEEGNAFNKKLVRPIPLRYSDSEAKEAIFKSILADIQHVKICSNKAILEVIDCYRNFQRLSCAGGKIKRPEETKRQVIGGKSGMMGMKNPVKVGPEYPENVIATFQHYLFEKPILNYARYLGYRDIIGPLHKLLVLPSNAILYPFLARLVIEHPKITKSWLQNWTLYDANGRLHGFKKTGKQYIAVSYKNRKRSKSAQQIVKLNRLSKILVEWIIELTSNCREHLKRSGNNEYRYMLLRANSLENAPLKFNTISNPCEETASEKLKSIYAKESLHGNNIIRCKKDGENIRASLTLRRLRAACGIKTYFETGSVEAMAEALGHNIYDSKLLSHYLPEPLWDYFSNRWIRIFQNAITLEAMKNSEYLFDAVDFTEKELEEFIKNHSIQNIPSVLKTKNNSSLNNSKKQLTFTVSVGLFQVLMGIVDCVNNDSIKIEINETASGWYDTARYIINSVESYAEDNLSMSMDQDVLNFFEIAKKNPLSVGKLQKVLGK